MFTLQLTSTCKKKSASDLLNDVRTGKISSSIFLGKTSTEIKETKGELIGESMVAYHR